MGKIPVHQFEVPILATTSQPYRKEGEKSLQVGIRWIEKSVFLDSAIVVDTGRKFWVKKVEYSGDDRGIMMVKGVTEKALPSGSLLVPGSWPLSVDEKGVFVPLGAMNQRWTLDHGVLMSPLFGGRGREVRISRLSNPESKLLLQISATRYFPMVLGSRYEIHGPDGEVLPVVLALPGPYDTKDIPLFCERIYKYPGQPSVNALYSLHLRIRGWVALPPPLEEEAFDDAIALGPVRIMKRVYETVYRKFLRLAAKSGGCAFEELQKALGFSQRALDALADQLVSEGKVRRAEGFWLSARDPLETLSPMDKSLFEKLDQAGIQGLRSLTVSNPVFKEAYARLIRLGLALDLEGWYYSRGTWKLLVTLLRQALPVGDAADFAFLRNAWGASRDQVLPLAKKLQEMGVLEEVDEGWLLKPEVKDAAE